LPPVLDDDNKDEVSDAIGGRAYYMGRIELELPLSSAMRSLGLRPSAFVDVGSVWKITKPDLANEPGTCLGPVPIDPDGTGPLPAPAQETQVLVPGEACDAGFTYLPNSGVQEFFRGNSVKPRLSIGIGVNWVSPFGPLRIDIAKALLKQDGDQTKLFSFNVGTQF
jgi:outer membrane protein insertion porin family